MTESELVMLRAALDNYWQSCIRESHVLHKERSQKMSLTVDQELAALKAENLALKAKEAKRTTLTFKIGEKGALSVYGMGRFPTTLYGQQWERLLERKEDILSFIGANRHKLATKE